MSPRTLTRDRIRGVSFHHQRSSTASRGSKKKSFSSSHNSWNTPELKNIENSAPSPFYDSDLRRLLHDQGRQEIHALVSECVEQLAQLRQLSQSIQRLSSENDVDRKFLDLEHAEESSSHPMRDVFVEVNRLQRLWRVRLEILEMIVMAQNSLRGFPAKFSGKLQQLEAASVQKKK